jgi:FixJ family two-component response regulator
MTMFEVHDNAKKMTLHFLEPDMRARAELTGVCASLGYHCEVYADLTELISYPPRSGIIFVRDDLAAGGVGVILERLVSAGIWLPAIAFDESPTATRVVQAVKSGALDYLDLPLREQRLAGCIARVKDEAVRHGESMRRKIGAQQMIARLSGRERQVLDRLASGQSNKEIARELNISPRTVEIHRANMMTKIGARHSAEAVRLRLEADMGSAAQEMVQLVAA